jgi:hypothetical protein
MDFPRAVARLQDFLEPVCDLRFTPKNATWDHTSHEWK